MRTPANSKRLTLYAAGLGILFFTIGRVATATTFNVDVAPGGDLSFSPASVSIHQGDTVTWTWRRAGHSVTSGNPDQQTTLFDSGVQNSGTFSFTFPNAGTFRYFCQPHGLCCGMVGNVVVAGSTLVPSQLLNISTRMRVQTGDNVLIGGFIITGTAPKKVLFRGLGPSLAANHLTGLLADPVLELHAADNSLITTNDNWKDTQRTAIENTHVQPTNDFESAIIATLPPARYTAIVRGKNGTSGLGLVEGYDLDTAAASKLANISSRGFVQSGDNVMIGGFIVGSGTGAKVLIRALGPSLDPMLVSNRLSDPTLELHNKDGVLIRSNDNWKSTQQTEIENTHAAPTNDLESAIVATLTPARYTAIVAGKNGTTGVGLVEVYQIP